MATDLITPLDHFSAYWSIDAEQPLVGSLAVGFTIGGRYPDLSTTWFAASWADEAVGALEREFSLTVAGSAAGVGAHPGVGDFTCWARYTDGASVRIHQAGTLRFR